MNFSFLNNEQLISEFEKRDCFGVSEYMQFCREFVKRLKEKQLELFGSIELKSHSHNHKEKCDGKANESDT